MVIDHQTAPEIGDALISALEEVGAKAELIRVPTAKRDSGEVPIDVANAMAESDVIFAAVQVSMTHTEATKQACARGARVAALTQWVPEMMMGGGIDADFRAIEDRVFRVAAILDQANEISVTTKAGTGMFMDVAGRLATPHAKTGVVRPGTFHPIPDIEVPISPVTGDGVIVCDASFPYLGIGLVKNPITLEVENGRVVSVQGGPEAEILKESWLSMNDPNVYHLAELGIGMNPRAKLTGRMLDDEGVATTCHFGIGSSYTLGGDVKASCHYDFVLKDPTISVDGVDLMKEGVLMLGP